MSLYVIIVVFMTKYGQINVKHADNGENEVWEWRAGKPSLKITTKDILNKSQMKYTCWITFNFHEKLIQFVLIMIQKYYGFNLFYPNEDFDNQCTSILRIQNYIWTT